METAAADGANLDRGSALVSPGIPAGDRVPLLGLDQHSIRAAAIVAEEDHEARSPSHRGDLGGDSHLFPASLTQRSRFHSVAP